MSFELGSGRAHQVTGPALPEPLEIIFTDDAAVEDPHPPGPAMFALHRIEHLLQRTHISSIAIEYFVAKRKTFRRDHQRQDDLFAVRTLIARVTETGFVDFLDLAFKVGAR